MITTACHLGFLVRLPLLVLFPCTLGAQVYRGDIDQPMQENPKLPVPQVVELYHRRLVPLMKMALARPDVETRRRAADAVGQLAAARIDGLESLVGPLEAILAGTDLKRGERQVLDEQAAVLSLAAARALIRLEARRTAATLLAQLAQRGPAMAALVDPALARWDFQPARALWMARLADPDTSRSLQILAIEALGTVRHGPAAERLEKIVLDGGPDAALRLTAARALGQIVTKALEPVAERLLDGQVHDRIVAVALVSHHDGSATTSLLHRLAGDREPAVAAAALERLMQIDPQGVGQLVEGLGLPPQPDEAGNAHETSTGAPVSRDPRIRQLMARAIVHQNTARAVTLVGPMLDDHHPQVRRYVRSQLIRMDADPHLSQVIRKVAVSMLDRDPLDHWRGIEQAALVLGTLDHEPAAGRLVELMSVAHPAVRLAATVALRRLAVAHTLVPVHERAAAISEATAVMMLDWVARMRGIEPVGLAPQMDAAARKAVKDIQLEDLDAQEAQMMQMFGQMGYREAEPLMRRHIPKHAHGVRARAAAIWALGQLYAAGAPKLLAGQLRDRLSDLNPRDPEAIGVRQASAIALGRMKAVEHVDALTHFYNAVGRREVAEACRWALSRIDGQTRPPLPVIYRQKTGFFIQPIDGFQPDEHLLPKP